MKIQLDTTEKTIKVEENVKLQDLFLLLEKILPKEEWKKFTLQTNTTINNWSSPIYIDRFLPSYLRTYPNTYPWNYPHTYYCNGTEIGTVTGSVTSGAANSSCTSVIPQGVTLTAGVFNIEG